MSDWDQFLYWAKRLAAEVDLETEEREYKIEAAGRWRAAMEACRESREDWPVLIKRAAGRGNLVDRHAQTWLGNAIDSWGDALREAFVAVDASDNVTAIDEFHATLTGWGDYISPGDATTLASLVRMSHSPESFPPYRARFVTDWAHRVGEEIGQRPTERYVALLVLCDDLIRIASEHDLNVRDRLDAQGLAWTVMKYSPPVRWSPMDQAQLLAWRRGEDTATVSVARGEGVAPEVERGAWEVLGAEAFNATFKREVLQDQNCWPDEATCRRQAFRWLTRYNTRRRHSWCGYRSPIAYEALTAATLPSAA